MATEHELQMQAALCNRESKLVEDTTSRPIDRDSQGFARVWAAMTDS